MEQNKAVNSVNNLFPLGVVDAMKNVSQNVVRNTAKLANNLPSLPNMSTMPTVSSIPWLALTTFVVFVVILIILFRTFNTQISEGYQKVIDMIRQSLGYDIYPPAPLNPSTPTTEPPLDTGSMPTSSVVEKVLPQGGNAQVFNVSKNTFTFYDAEPLCKALGAELATYEQVKDAYEKGADWCNYGWTKGQMAVYPTQKETWEKLQQGPEEQRRACGNPGMNGGFFDNPELRYGVNCYGSKPSQSSHDATKVALGTPSSPGALEFDKKVSKFRSQSDNIGILPFNTGKWSS